MISAVLKSQKQKAKAIARGDVTSSDHDVAAEIARDISTDCPGFDLMMKTVRQFTSRYLADCSNEVIGVMSVGAGEGSTTVALGLAGALADIKERVVYVETQLASNNEAPVPVAPVTLHTASYLAADDDVESRLISSSDRKMSILPASNPNGQDRTLSKIPSIKSSIQQLRRSFNVILVDLPPLLSSEDTPAILASLDRIVLVVAAGETQVTDVERALSLCPEGKVAGVFVNRSERRIPRWLGSLIGG